MKKKYKILIGVIGIEWLCVLILSEMEIQIDSLIGGMLGLMVFFVPVLLLLYLLTKDDNISPKNRILSKVFFVFIIVSCFAGIVVKILGINV